MPVYRIKDLLDRLHEMFQHGYEYVELHSQEDGDAASLSLKGSGDSCDEIECQTIASCQYGQGDDSESDDDTCYEVQFSYDEIATIASALANMPAIYQNAINDETYDPREQEAFRTMSEKMTDLKTKIEQAFRNTK